MSIEINGSNRATVSIFINSHFFGYISFLRLPLVEDIVAFVDLQEKDHDFQFQATQTLEIYIAIGGISLFF